MLFLITVLSRSLQIVQIRVMLPDSPSALCERRPPQPGEPSGGQLPGGNEPRVRRGKVNLCANLFTFLRPSQHSHVAAVSAVSATPLKSRRRQQRCFIERDES